MTRNRERAVDGEAALDRIFTALSDPVRRAVLVAVRERNPRRTAEFANGERTGQDRALTLQHRHLPLLAEAGFVDWDRESDTISRGPAFEEVDPLLGLLAADTGELHVDRP